MAIGITSHVTHIATSVPSPLTNSNKLPTPTKKTGKVPHTNKQTNQPQTPKLETQTPQSFTSQLRPFWRAREGERQREIDQSRAIPGRCCEETDAPSLGLNLAWVVCVVWVLQVPRTAGRARWEIDWCGRSRVCMRELKAGARVREKKSDGDADGDGDDDDAWPWP